MTCIAATMDASIPSEDAVEPPLSSLRPLHNPTPVLSPVYDITPDMTDASISGSSSPGSSRQQSRDGDLPTVCEGEAAEPTRPGAGVRMLSWSLVHAPHGAGDGDEDEDTADQAEAYMRSGLIALRLFAAEHAQAHAAQRGKRRKHVAWAGDAPEHDEAPSSENVTSDEEGSVVVPPLRLPLPVAAAVAKEDRVDDWIDEDGQVWQHHVVLPDNVDHAGKPVASDRREDVALVVSVAGISLASRLC